MDRIQLVMKPSLKDHYYYKAKKEGLAARSAFKLQELDKKYKLFKQNQRVLDLGACPGSWMQYVSSKVGEKGMVCGVDVKEPSITLECNMQFIKESIYDLDPSKLSAPFDAVISDMAPKTIGQSDIDQERSYELCLKALSLALKHLKPKGFFICKIFQSQHVKQLLNEAKDYFMLIKTQKPKSSLSKSMEVFVLAMGFRGHKHN